MLNRETSEKKTVLLLTFSPLNLISFSTFSIKQEIHSILYKMDEVKLIQVQFLISWMRM